MAVRHHADRDELGARRAIRDRQQCEAACDACQEATAAKRYSFPHSFSPLIQMPASAVSLGQIVSMKQRRSSLCPCPHLTVIPAAIPERIKRWRALLVLETKRLKFGALLTELNQTSLRFPQDCYPGRLEVQKKRHPSLLRSTSPRNVAIRSVA